jgi:hypothetical protein
VGDIGGFSDDRRARLAGRAERIASACVRATGTDSAGVSLVTRRGYRATVCATDDTAARIEEVQFVLGEGPCVEAATNRSPVLVADLLDHPGGPADRWPAFLDAASAAGVRAVFAFPVRIGAIALGAVDLLRSRPGDLDDGELAAALLAADALALLLLDLSAGGADGDGDHGDDGWQRSAYRFKVHGAAGMITAQLGVPIEQAMARLRAAAYAQERPVTDIADDVIAGRLSFEEES